MAEPDPDPLDRLEAVAEKVAVRAQHNAQRAAYESGNRFGLLWVHAAVGIVAGAQMLFFGTATQIETVVGPYARLIMGPLALVGGLVLAAGLSGHPRRIKLEAAGLVTLAGWDLIMTLCLAFARYNQHYYQVLAIGQPTPPGYVPAYPASIYGGMFALLVIHVMTLRFVWKERKWWRERKAEGEEADHVAGTD